MLDMKKATKLKQLREELHIVQEDVALSAGVRLNTYRRAEWGQKVSYTTATGILRAINGFRVNRRLEPLVLEDLELTIV